MGSRGAFASSVVAIVTLVLSGGASAQDSTTIPALQSAQQCYAGTFSACADAGDAYHEGWGVAVSPELAAQYYRYGCNGGDARSCRALGYVTQNGDGVPQSYPEAMRLYELSCNGGYALACYDLGTMHWTGTGTPVSWPEGQRYYERSCQMRHADGCREVAYIHGRGMGVPRDYARMAEFLRLSCDLGNPTACTELRDPASAAAAADSADGSGGGGGGGGGGGAGVGVGIGTVVMGMPDPQFQDLLSRFRRDTRSTMQTRLARDTAAAGAVLSCAQIAQLMQTTPVEGTRTMIGVILYSRAVDPESFYVMEQALTREGSRVLLRQQTGH